MRGRNQPIKRAPAANSPQELFCLGAAKADRRLCVRFRGPPQSSYQVQVIWPPADDEQVLVVSECDAAAAHEAGGPVTAVAVTVTLADGRKPWREVVPDALPEKYVPALSAA
jgi:hypothetical protein